MKNRKIRIILAYLIGLMPTSKLRVFFYRSIFKYKFNNSLIGWRTVIVVESAEFSESQIGRNNKFIGPMRVIINKGANVGANNVFMCGWWTQEEKYKTSNYKCHLLIGINTLITIGHHFDVVGAFVLGNNSWVAGRGSQFWTHGAGTLDRDISIGENCYIGSAVRFAPGSSVSNNSIVGLGSIVTKKFDLDNVIIAGHPAKIIRKNYDWKTQEDL